MMIKLYIIFLSISILLTNGCKENPGSFTIGEKFIESNTNLTLIDTFTVNLSTVIMDTVITSGTGSLLVGNYSDNIFGKITSSSYFQVGNPDRVDVDKDDRYDSLYLVIKYNKYSSGDTTKMQKISVHQLTENIKFNDNGVITGKTSFNYNSQPIGAVIYTPMPNSPADTLLIKISDDIGHDLFSKLRDASEIMLTSENFINYFHGLALVPGDSYSGSVTGFSAAQEDVRLVLCTSRDIELSTVEINYEFKLEDTKKQFNNFTHDFSSTQLSTLSAQRNELPDSKTGGLSFLQGGTGLTIRVDFPSLPEILQLKRGTVVEAQLSIGPVQNNSKEFPLPAGLTLYQSDKANSILASVASSTLISDDLYHEKTAYLFDVTKYLVNEIAGSYIDPEKGLLISLPDEDLKTGFKRLIADSKNLNTKLKIYYLSY